LYPKIAHRGFAHPKLRLRPPLCLYASSLFWDFGETWEILPLPTPPNATIWGLATHAANPNRIVAFSLFGEVHVSEDAGANWRKIAREFGEIRAAVWVPN